MIRPEIVWRSATVAVIACLFLSRSLVADEVVLMEALQADVNQEKVDPTTKSLRVHLQVEKSLMRRVCQLTDEQKTAIEKFDNKWLQTVINEKQPVNQAPPGGLIGALFGAQPVRKRAVDLPTLQARVDAKLIVVLDEKQTVDFEHELQQRLDFRNGSTADALIERLQDRMDLTDEQRANLKKKIVSWIADTDPTVAHFYSGNDVFPQIPVHLLDALTAQQMKTYEGLQKTTFRRAQIGNQHIVIKN